MSIKYLTFPYVMTDGVSSTLDAALFNPIWEDIDLRLNDLETGLVVAKWTMATRPVPTAGQYYIGVNTDLNQVEFYDGTDWTLL